MSCTTKSFGSLGWQREKLRRRCRTTTICKLARPPRTSKELSRRSRRKLLNELRDSRLRSTGSLGKSRALTRVVCAPYTQIPCDVLHTGCSHHANRWVSRVTDRCPSLVQIQQNGEFD